MKNRKLGGPSGQEQQDNKRLSNISNRIGRIKRIKTGEESVDISRVLPRCVKENALHYYNQHKVVIPSVSFTVGSNHKMLTNMKQKTLRNKHIRQLVEFDIYETVKNQLSLGTSIQLQKLDEGGKAFIYSIVKSNTPPSISFASMDDVDISDHSIIEVEPLSMLSNTNMHVHPAIEKHLLPCGQAVSK